MQESQVKDEYDIAHQKFNEIAQKKSEMEGLMNTILEKVKENKTLKSIDSLSIIELLFNLKPFISSVDQSISDVEDVQFIEFYQTFRKIFKTFRLNLEGAIEEIEDTFSKGKVIPKEKIDQIKNNILNMKGQLQKIQQGVFEQSKRYLLWIDYNIDNQESQKYLQDFYNLCNGLIKIKTFTNDKQFREYIQNKSQRLFYIVMSGKAAGEYEGDGQHLKWLNQYMKDSKNTKVQIYGVIIFTSYKGYPYFKDLVNTQKGFVHEVAQEIDPVLECLKKLIFPKENVRVIHLEQIDCFFVHNKQNFLSFGKENFANLKITDYHPDKPFIVQGDKSKINKDLLKQYEGKNLLERLIFVQRLVQQYKLKISNDQLKPNEIYSQLKQCFQEKESQEQISKNILRLYTSEGAYYKFINSVLGILNEEILTSIWDLFTSLKIAINSYDDSKSKIPTQIKMDGTITKLYRGVSIPHQQFKSTYKKGQIILMCGFLSFSTNLQVAQIFSTYFAANKNVVFRLNYKCGQLQYPNRPKFLKEFSVNKEEDEYLFPCSQVFIIKDIVEQDPYTYVDIEI